MLLRSSSRLGRVRCVRWTWSHHTVSTLTALTPREELRKNVASSSHSTGLTLQSSVDYPAVVTQLVDIIKNSPITPLFESSLREVLKEEPRAGTLLARHFAINDDLGNAFRVLHCLIALDAPRDRELYRYLMYACCKYHDTDLALFTLENMLLDRKPDFASFKRLFDACAAGVDLRLWVSYDAMMYFYPLRGTGSAALRTTGYITEFMKSLGMQESARAGRGFVTLPNHRGNMTDVFKGLFEEEDPNYPDESPRDATRIERLELIPEEFEDKNRMKQIVSRFKAREENGGEEVLTGLSVLDQKGLTVDVVRATVVNERKAEMEGIEKMKRTKAILAELDKPVSLTKAISEFLIRRKATKKLD